MVLNLDFLINTEIVLRAGGNVSDIAIKLQLGSPVAGNFFLAEAK